MLFSFYGESRAGRNKQNTIFVFLCTPNKGRAVQFACSGGREYGMGWTELGNGKRWKVVIVSSLNGSCFDILLAQIRTSLWILLRYYIDYLQQRWENRLIIVFIKHIYLLFILTRIWLGTLEIKWLLWPIRHIYQCTKVIQIQRFVNHKCSIMRNTIICKQTIGLF